MSDWNIPQEYLDQQKEIERLRAALRQIAGGDHIPAWELMDIAREALDDESKKGDILK